MSSISIIIPVRNEGVRIAETLNSILVGKTQNSPLEILIVDDASSDGCCENLFSVDMRYGEVEVKVVRLESRAGIPHARNYGARMAKYPIYIMTDGNVRFPNGWDSIVEAYFHPLMVGCAAIADSDSSFTGFGCQLEFPSMGVTWISNENACGDFVPIAPCTFTVIARELFNLLGGYDEELPMYGAAEPEFSIRAWLNGYSVVLYPTLVVEHRFRPIRQLQRDLDKMSYLMVSNYLRFACLYLPSRLLERTYHHYGQLYPAQFQKWIEDLNINDGWRTLWARRRYFEETLLRSFQWFANQFEVEGIYDPVETMSGLSVVILTHEQYFPWLPQVLAAVYAQKHVLEKIILVINSDERPILRTREMEGIEIIQKVFSSPNSARNAGLNCVTSDWVCYVDGDNIPVDGYFEAMAEQIRMISADVAIIYPDVARIREDGSCRLLVMPEWNYWTGRERSIIDTSSAWRTLALRQAGGWFLPAECLQDYATALRVTELGWAARRAIDLVSVLTDHAWNISKRRSQMVSETLWHVRKVVVVTLFAGRNDCLNSLMHWYVNENFPPNTHIIWVDNSHDESFSRTLAIHAAIVRENVGSVEIWREEARPLNPYSFLEIHGHVAFLYNEVFNSVAGDIYLTVEDDVIAPVGSVRKILTTKEMMVNQNWGGLCAVYPSRANRNVTCASVDRQYWIGAAVAELPEEVIEMGMIGAGFAAWSGPAIQKCLPLSTSVRLSGYQHGWDGTLCQNLATLGYRVGIIGSIKCEHLTQTPKPSLSHREDPSSAGFVRVPK